MCKTCPAPVLLRIPSGFRHEEVMKGLQLRLHLGSNKLQTAKCRLEMFPLNVSKQLYLYKQEKTAEKNQDNCFTFFPL